MKKEITFERFLENNNISFHDVSDNTYCIVKDRKDFNTIIKGSDEFGINGDFVIQFTSETNEDEIDEHILPRETRLNNFNEYSNSVRELINELYKTNKISILNMEQALLVNIGKIIQLNDKNQNMDDFLKIIKENIIPGYYYFNVQKSQCTFCIGLDDLNEERIGYINLNKTKFQLKFKY